MSTAKKIETDYNNMEDYFPFPTMRTGQDYIFHAMKKHLLNPEIRYILIEASTGLGKSALALAAAGASKAAYLATANKFLQDQYSRDFSDIMVELKGRANYRCNCHEVPEELKETIGKYYNCGNSPCRNTPETRGICAKDRSCEYHKQLSRAARATITSFNFASALAFLNYMQSYFKPRNLLVCDECHNLPDWITNFVSIDITVRTLKELELKTIIPEYDSVSEYAMFISDVQHEINYKLNNEELVDSKIVHKLENFQKKLELFDTITNTKQDMGNFVMEKTYDHDNKIKIVKIAFKPVVIADIIHEYLFDYADKILLLSATILDFDTYTEIMGIDPKQTAIIKVPSTFPVENRPIYTHMSVGYINKNNIDAMLPNMVKVIRAILDHYPAYKGIIHGVTYKICDYLYEYLNDSRILYPRKAEQQKEYFETHLASAEPTILLSPSMTEGVDLKHDSSRLQIIAKTPYAYLGDPVLKARMEIYENYYNMLTALHLTQAYGRSIRDENDFCFTFILDKCVLSFVAANKDILQSSFLEAFQE